MRNQIKETSFLPLTGCAIIRLTEKLKKVNRKELLKQFSLIFIFITFITVLGISKGETYLSYTDTESPCEDYDYRQQNKAQCENWNGPTVVSNILFDENGDIDLTKLDEPLLYITSRQ